MIEKIQEKIDKYRISRSAEPIYMSRAESVLKFNLICEFITDLEKLLANAKEKKKACCEKKEGRRIAVTSCRKCPYLMACAQTDDYCNHPEQKEIVGRVIRLHDIIQKWCPL